MSVLVICEKPSQAQGYAAVIGANKRENGYFSGNGYIVAYDMAENDETLTPEQVGVALAELVTRKEKYEGYLSELMATAKTQILETDPEAHRMHSKNGFHCCYNVQTAVDSGSHLIAEYEVTSRNTDQGLLKQVCEQAKEKLGVETIEAVADKGYEKN